MKREIIPIIILSAIIIVVFSIAISSFDKHMYQGVDVLGQNQDILLVALDDRLRLGTDGMCLEATYALQQVALQSGCNIQVVSLNGEWVPFNGEVKSYMELTSIIESGTSY